MLLKYGRFGGLFKRLDPGTGPEHYFDIHQPGGAEVFSVRTSWAFLALLVWGAGYAGGVPWSHYNIIDAPSAHTLQHTEVAVGGSFVPFSVEDSLGNSSTEFAYGAFLEMGVLGRGQVGVTYLGNGGISGTARFLLLRETIRTPGISIGCENITGEENYEGYTVNDSLYDYGENQNFSVYAVFTKDFRYYLNIPVCVNIGYGIGRFTQKDGPDDGFDNPVPGLFGSLVFHPTPESGIIIEWDGRDLNLGGEYSLSRSVTLKMAYTEIEQHFRPSDRRDMTDPGQAPKFALGMTVTLGPLFDRTELSPYQRLRFTEDDEALEAIRRERENARRRIEELERLIR